MTTLEDAWQWYLAARESLRVIERLAEKHWDDLPWDGGLGRDNRLQDCDGSKVFERARTGKGPLDDLAVLVLFSVFESEVRGLIGQQVEAEARDLRHPALIHAAKGTLDSIENGSFFRVLEPYKNLDAGLIESVNQVRRYRNWVAHGRRGEAPGNPPIPIDPRTAYERLTRLLDAMIPKQKENA